jgi:hypothetical protein
MTIAAAFTAGDSNHLLAGRNGVFYDRKGQDWDATITKIIEHPISIGQAIWSPYKRIGRMVGEQIEKLAAARDKAMQDEAAAKVAQTSKMAESGKPAAGPAPAPGGVANMVGILAAVGLALGAIGTALATFVKSFLGLSWWQMPLAVLGMMLLVSGPSVIIAWLKLRQRNLAPILDANGWAVNGRVRINIPFGGALTATAKLPPNAVRALEDPYAEKHPVRGWLMMLFLAVLLGAAGYYWYQYSRTKSQPKASTKPVLEAPQKAAPASPAAGAK